MQSVIILFVDDAARFLTQRVRVVYSRRIEGCYFRLSPPVSHMHSFLWDHPLILACLALLGVATLFALIVISALRFAVFSDAFVRCNRDQLGLLLRVLECQNGKRGCGYF
jgi:hypothetical protein